MAAARPAEPTDQVELSQLAGRIWPAVADLRPSQAGSPRTKAS